MAVVCVCIQQDWENLSAWPGLEVYGQWRMKEVLFGSVHAVLGSDWDQGLDLPMRKNIQYSLKPLHTISSHGLAFVGSGRPREYMGAELSANS